MYDNRVTIGWYPWNYTADYNKLLKSVIIEEGITTVGAEMFRNCYSLESVKIADSVTAIGYAAFISCPVLTNVILGDGVTTIGNDAFNYCIGLTDIVIPEGVAVINDRVFMDCYSLATVTIPNSVTIIGDWAFRLRDSDALYKGDVLSTIIYSGTQAQWETVAVGEYNEALENATVLYTGEIKLSNAAPTLYDNIAMNYKADKTRFDELGITDPYLVVSFNGNETTLTDYTVSEDGAQYVFTFFNIAPNQMDDTLTATLYATYGDDVYEGATLEYSVATYCYRMLNNSTVVNNDAYAELRTLLVDLLHYGAMAQKFTGFTGETVDARLTEAQLAWGTTATPTLESKTNAKYATVTTPTAAWASVGLVLEDAVTMRFKFTADSIDGISVKITSDTNPEGWIISEDGFQYEESTGRYYVDFGGLHAGQMRESVYVTVYDGDTAVSNTLRYTVESYAQKYQAADETTYPNLAELVKAMMRYGDAAYNFAN